MHPDTAGTLFALGLLHNKKGEYDLALEYLKQTLDIARKKLGNQHPNTQRTFEIIAILYEQAGDEEKAAKYRAMLVEPEEDKQE